MMMGFAHLDKRAVPAVLAARERGEVIDHLTAAMIIDAFTGSWATCWFADTGNFAVATECLPSTCAGEVYGDRDPVEAMDNHLFHWYGDDESRGQFRDIWDDENRIPMLREELRKYMENRWRDGDGECGAVRGWVRKPFA